MTITILYTDLRTKPSILQKSKVDWRSVLSAFDAIAEAIGSDKAQKINNDLLRNDQELMVSWYNPNTDEISEIGGVGRLDWILQDNTVLTINYDNGTATSEQINEADIWTVQNDPSNDS